MSSRILICTDLDRTLLPNGPQPESPQARPLFRKLAAHPDITLAYVSGRHLALIEDAISEYALPRPDFAVADVGTSIYRPDGESWQLWESWSQHIGADWAGHSALDLQPWFDDLDEIALQEADKQGRYKLSYYAPTQFDRAALFNVIALRLKDRGVQAKLVWSVDETSDTGLLDILPAAATKLGAVRFLMAELGFDAAHTLFAGDSGNDLEVLTSGIPAVLVANATEAVRAEAVAHAPSALYLARGGVMDMNGNYSAGIVEALLHFHPHLRAVF